MAKKINEVETVAQMNENDYATVILADGSLGKIKKSDLSDTLITGFSFDKLYDRYGYNMKQYVIDASVLDENTWYPVTMPLTIAPNVRIEIIVALNSGTKPSWSIHNGGFSCRAIWEVNGQGYGATHINRTIYEFDSAWTEADARPVGGIGQMSNGSIEYIYVRGGGKYFFRTSHNVGPTLRTETYTLQNQSVSPTATKPALSRRTYVRVEELDGKIEYIAVTKGAQTSFDYKEECRFYVNNRNSAIIGAPESGFFLCTVNKISSAYSLLTAYNVDGGRTFNRAWVDNSWHAWRALN